MLTLAVDLADYQRGRRESVRVLRAGIRKAVKEAVEDAADYARNNHTHKRRSGFLTDRQQLRGYITRNYLDGADGVIENRAFYAPFIEYGTRPHRIWPKEGHGFAGPLKPGQGRRAIDDIGTHRIMLRFQVGGRTVFAPYVDHPGNRPMPFMEPTGPRAAETIRLELYVDTFTRLSQIWN